LSHFEALEAVQAFCKDGLALANANMPAYLASKTKYGHENKHLLKYAEEQLKLSQGAEKYSALIGDACKEMTGPGKSYRRNPY